MAISGIEFRPIALRIELDAVHALTYSAYLAKGYCQPNATRRLIHYPHLDHISQTTVFIALERGRIVGTISWTRDGPAGLHVDNDFKSEADKIRAERNIAGVPRSRILASAWRMAISKESRGVTVLMGLIHKTVRAMTGAGVETALFTFNPAHELAYKTILNMRTVARRNGTIGLSNAPAVLMRLDLADVPDKFMKHWVG